MGWHPPQMEPLAHLPPPRPSLANWPGLLDPPPGPLCRCRLGDRIRMAWSPQAIADGEAVPLVGPWAVRND
eukprot:1501097-Alexandrium_andersonii.AAC.1